MGERERERISVGVWEVEYQSVYEGHPLIASLSLESVGWAPKAQL